MDLSTQALHRIARGAAALAGLAGTYGFLVLMGAFGPVSCRTGQSVSDTSDGTGTSTITRSCEAGIDFLLGSTNGNAPVLFFWAVVLLVFSGFGVVTVWTGRRRAAWVLAGVGGVVSIVGLMSIGWLFLLPTLSLVGGAAALTVAARRAVDSG